MLTLEMKPTVDYGSILNKFFKAKEQFYCLKTERIHMKKIIISVIVFVSLISLFSTLTTNVLGQPENVEVLSYSWYLLQADVLEEDYLVIVGEVQNVGPNILEFIRLQGVVYTTDGEAQAVSFRAAYGEQILPQQKAPFKMYITGDNSFSGDLNWLSIGIDRVEFLTVEANVTEDYQYQDLEITSSTNYISSEDLYTVSGNLRNTGNQAAGRLWVVATFYNASGTVVANGFTEYLDPDSLPPGQTTTFTVAPLDALPDITGQITNYSLLIQTESPIIPEFPSFLIIPLFIVTTLVAVTVYRRRLMKKASK
jgi:hypothetical protein